MVLWWLGYEELFGFDADQTVSKAFAYGIKYGFLPTVLHSWASEFCHFVTLGIKLGYLI